MRRFACTLTSALKVKLLNFRNAFSEINNDFEPITGLVHKIGNEVEPYSQGVDYLKTGWV